MKKVSILALLSVCLLALAACGTIEQPDRAEENNEKTENVNEDEETNGTETAPASDEPSIINDLGIFVGQADPHTVEIETNEGPKAFQLTEKSTEQIEQLQPNDSVKFQYIVNEHKQNVLQSIEKMQGTESEEDSAETGVYNGQQDPHTIEIETEDGPTAFQLSDDVKKQVESLEIGKKVSFTYRVEGPQLIIENIKQKE